jgi:hypothetical protein
MAFANILGGESALQSQDALSSVLNFNPQRQLGSGSGNYMSASNEQTETSEQTAKQDASNSATASVGVGVGGGSGSGGAATSSATDTMALGTENITKYLPYILIGGGGLFAISMFMSRKK